MKTLIILAGALWLAAFAHPLAAADAAPKKGKLLHLVAFKFKAGATQDQSKQVEDAFRGLNKKIREIKSYEWGTNASPEKHDKGFTPGFILGFRSAKDRDTYLEHPQRKEFGKLVGPVLADVFVIDFWAKD